MLAKLVFKHVDFEHFLIFSKLAENGDTTLNVRVIFRNSERACKLTEFALITQKTTKYICYIFVYKYLLAGSQLAKLTNTVIVL